MDQLLGGGCTLHVYSKYEHYPEQKTPKYFNIFIDVTNLKLWPQTHYKTVSVSSCQSPSALGHCPSIGLKLLSGYMGPYVHKVHWNRPLLNYYSKLMPHFVTCQTSGLSKCFPLTWSNCGSLNLLILLWPGSYIIWERGEGTLHFCSMKHWTSFKFSKWPVPPKRKKSIVPEQATCNDHFNGVHKKQIKVQKTLSTECRSTGRTWR